jgi:hypothetical protein
MFLCVGPLELGLFGKSKVVLRSINEITTSLALLIVSVGPTRLGDVQLFALVSSWKPLESSGLPPEKFTADAEKLINGKRRAVPPPDQVSVTVSAPLCVPVGA